MFISICFDASNPMSEGLLQASSAPPASCLGCSSLAPDPHRGHATWEPSGWARSQDDLGAENPWGNPIGNLWETSWSVDLGGCGSFSGPKLIGNSGL